MWFNANRIFRTVMTREETVGPLLSGTPVDLELDRDIPGLEVYLTEIDEETVEAVV